MRMNKLQAAIKLFTNLNRSKKILLTLKVFTTWMLGVTIVSMLAMWQGTIYLWALTFILSSATIIYGVYCWLNIPQD